MSKNSQPTRMCVACMTRMPKAELTRIVRTSEGTANIDAEHKIQGRGAYICLKAECIAAAEKKNRFSRALKGNVDKTIYDELRNLVSKE